MTDSSFVLLHDIGTLILNNEEEIRFSLDAFHGYRYVSVRRYLKIQDELFAPTREGVTLTPDMLRAFLPVLLSLPDDPKQLQAGLLGKLAKRPGICVLVEIARVQGELQLVFRPWTQEKGTGKPSLGIPLTQWTEIRQLFSDSLATLEEQPSLDF